MKLDINIIYKRKCPICKIEILYTGSRFSLYNLNKAECRGDLCRSCAQKKNPNKFWKGKERSKETKDKISKKQKGRVLSNDIRKNMSIGQKKSWQNEEVKKKYYDALSKTKWIRVRSDIGQLELINKWNKLGFNFEPNYQIKTDKNLFYVDGYDKEKNVVLEYDSKYHKRQKEKDLVRQNKIIEIIKPKKFRRYNSDTKQIKNVIQDAR